MGYDVGFFQGLNNIATRAAEIVLPIAFTKLGVPERVVDFGCGCGAWLAVAKKLTTKFVLGFDGPWVPRHLLLVEPEEFVVRDLSQPVAAAPADLAICVEVAEHLPPDSGPALVDALVRTAPTIIFSAATPGQGGDGHVNERPHAYWERLFRAHQYRPETWLRDAVENDEGVAWWYRRNLMVFRA